MITPNDAPIEGDATTFARAAIDYPEYVNGEVLLIALSNSMLEQILIVEKADEKALATVELLQEFLNADPSLVQTSTAGKAFDYDYVVTFGTSGYQLGVVTYRLTYSRDRSFVLMDRVM